MKVARIGKLLNLSPGVIEHANCYIREKVRLAQNNEKSLVSQPVADNAAACADACVEHGEDCDTFIYGKLSRVCTLFKGAELNLELRGGVALRDKVGGWCPLNGGNTVT